MATPIAAPQGSEHPARGINWILALVSGLTLVLILAYAGLDPQGMKSRLTLLQDGISRYFGWWYILLDAVFISPVFIIPFTKWGRLKLGKPGDTPDYTRFEWLAMLLCCTFAIGIIIWAVAEPLFHFMHPPRATDPGSMDALKDAFRITIFHMGVGGFGLFAVAGAAIALPAYRYGLPVSFSTAFYGLLKDKAYGRFTSTGLELVAMIVNFLGISTSVGLGLISLRYGIHHVFGIELDPAGMILLTSFIAAGFCWSVWRGLDNGIKTLSLFNTYLAIFVMIYVLCMGPTRPILNWMVQNTGYYFGNLIEISLFTDAGEQAAGGKWMSAWTVFYWGWWFSWVPFVAGFLARISKGRSLREMMLGATFMPVITVIIWYTTLGVAATYTEMNTPGVSQLWAEVQKDVGAGFYVMVANWPFGSQISMLVLFVLFVFLVTSADSAAFFCAMQLTNGNPNPDRTTRIVSGCAIAALSIVLILIGGLKACQSASVLGGLPISFLLVLIFISFWKFLLEEGKKLNFNRYY